MFYGKGNHLIRCIVYILSYAFLQCTLIVVPIIIRTQISSPIEGLAVWQTIVVSFLGFAFCALACIGELILRRMKLLKKDDRAIEAARVKFIYAICAVAALLVSTAIFIRRS